MLTNKNLRFNDIKIDMDEDENDNTSGELEVVSKNDIAIIGISGIFPEAENVNEFWKNISLGKDCINPISEFRKNDYEKLISRSPGIDNIKRQNEYAECGYLNRIDQFDNEYFSISPKEAKLMDPNQRLFLQSSVRALEDAGYGGKKLKSSDTGLFLGFSSDFSEEYKNFLLEKTVEVADLAITGNIHSIIASRIAHILDFHGPSLVIDTACSSSLVAVHYACKSIRSGECEIALAGSIKIQLQPFRSSATGIGIVSPTYRARTFDHDANGTGLGEGVGVLVLKELTRAVSDGDNIHAVIKGSSVNQDGRSVGVTAPNSAAQEELIIKSWQDANIEPESISLIEAHGTATKLGDPIEVDGIRKAFLNFTDKKQFCAIGSVKTNIGHLDHMAGISGLIKCILALKNKVLPPTVNFMNPNRQIDFVSSPVYINDKAQEWKQGKYPRRCGINSFGLSGTNCHLILEEAGVSEISTNKTLVRHNILSLSAEYLDGLKRLIEEYYHYLNTSRDIDLENLCYTSNTGRGNYSVRIAIIFVNIADLLEKLSEILLSSFPEVNIKNVFFNGEKDIHQKQNKLSNQELYNVIESINDTDQNNSSITLLNQVAIAYIAGLSVPWQLLYTKKKYQRISLPAYPFRKTRCWVKPGAYEDHLTALVKRKAIHSNNIEIYETYLDVDNCWFMAEHKIFEYYVLPGTVYIEMIAGIFQKKMDSNLQFICENFVFLQPLQVKSDESRCVHIILTKQKNMFDVVISSINIKEDEWITHFKGIVHVQDIKDNEPVIDIKKIIGNSEILDVAGSKPGADAPVQTGPHWECMTHMYKSDDSLAVFIQLPLQFASEISNFTLHPSLLDCAVNIPINQITNGLYLPFSYKKITLWNKMPQKFYSILTGKQFSDNQLNKQNQETFSYNITLCDENGTVFAEIEHYTLKKVQLGDYIKHDQKMDQMFHSIIWKEASGLQNEIVQGSYTLILAGKDDQSQKIIAELINTATPLIIVQMGDNYQVDNDSSIFIDGSQDSYYRLCRDLYEKPPKRIIHSLLLGSDKRERIIYDPEQEKFPGVKSLFYLTRALVKYKIKEKIDILLLGGPSFRITNNESRINPFNSAFFHLGKVVSAEYSNLCCRSIDLDSDTDISSIKEDLYHLPESYFTAYRNGKRYIQELIEVEPDKQKENILELRDKGCYMITGGTGSLALAIAVYLSEIKSVNLVLLNRSGVPAKEEWEQIIREGKDFNQIRKIQNLQKISANGSSYDLFNVDVSHKDSLKHAISKIRTKYGNINGIIHASGIAGDGFLFNKNEAQFDEVIASKIDSSYYLHQFIPEALDFFVCFSSVTSLEGTPGQGDYAAANGFLDSFTTFLPENQNGLTLNWAAWKEIGMAYDYGIVNDQNNFFPLSTKQALRAFELSFSLGLKQVLIGEIDRETVLSRINTPFTYHLNNILSNLVVKQSNYQVSKEIVVSSEEKIATLDIKDASLQELKSLIIKLWCRLLEVDSINLNDTFISRGGNSIFAVYLLNELESYFPGYLDISDIFTYSTINQMAEYIFGKMNNKQKILAVSSKDSKKDEEDVFDQVLQNLANGELDIEEIDQLLDFE